MHSAEPCDGSGASRHHSGRIASWSIARGLGEILFTLVGSSATPPYDDHRPRCLTGSGPTPSSPGFSTTTSVTDTSGRGVGMDVVKTNISRLGGVIDVQSEHGIGSKFTITLPVTLAIISALLVRVRDRWYALPITSVQEAIALDEKSVRTVEGREVLTLRGGTLPICRLERLFDIAHLPRKGHGRQYVVVSALGHRRLGFVVDAVDLGGLADPVDTRTAELLVTMDSPPWYFRWVTRMPGHQQMKRAILEYSGIRVANILALDDVLIGEDQLADTFGFRYRNGSFSTLLPFLLRAGVRMPVIAWPLINATGRPCRFSNSSTPP